MKELLLPILVHFIGTANGQTYDCSLYQHYFTVDNGKFTDVCGGITMYGVDGSRPANQLPATYLSSNINAADNTFKIFGDNSVVFTPFVPFASTKWGIIFEGYSTKPTKTGFNIILGPSGQSQNCQLRYENGNGICMYSYYPPGSSMAGWCVQLPFDINRLHKLVIYYDNGIIKVYQNGQFVQSIAKTFQIAFGKIGAWFHTYYGQINVKNIMFLQDVPLQTCTNGLVFGLPIS